MKIFFTVLATLLMLWTAPARAQAPEGWIDAAQKNETYLSLKTMQQAEPARLVPHLSLLVKTYQTPQNLEAVIAFLSEMSYGEKAQDKLNIDFFLLYSDAYFLRAHLTKAPKEQRVYLQQALKGAMMFEALAMADGARCVDDKAWPAYKSQVLSERLGRLSVAYAAFQPDEFLLRMSDTLTEEDKLIGRPPNASICGGTNAALFADPYTWSNTRQKARAILGKFWRQRYEKATKATLGEE